MSEPVSMEAFGPVSIDYFHGRSVERIDMDDNAIEDDPQWTVVFEGGGEIQNFDPTIAAPEGIEGLALNLSTLDRGVTRLYFGTEENPRSTIVHLNPMEYAIRDETYTRGKVVFAQRSNANMPMETPPHPDERVAEGPTEPEVPAEEESASEDTSGDS